MNILKSFGIAAILLLVIHPAYASQQQQQLEQEEQSVELKYGGKTFLVKHSFSIQMNPFMKNSNYLLFENLSMGDREVAFLRYFFASPAEGGKIDLLNCRINNDNQKKSMLNQIPDNNETQIKGLALSRLSISQTQLNQNIPSVIESLGLNRNALQQLVLSANAIDNDQLKEILSQKYSGLKDLQLPLNKIESLGFKYFLCSAAQDFPKLEFVSFFQNQITDEYFDDQEIQSLPKQKSNVKTIDLKNNKIKNKNAEFIVLIQSILGDQAKILF